MNQRIIDFIQSQRICVLAVEMLDGSPHSATVHFAYDVEAGKFYFETYRDYRKCEALFGRGVTRASVVVGFDESNMKTLQMDGTVSLLSENEKGRFDEVYLGKFQNKKEKSQDPKFVFFTFTPMWWRFTDWTGPNGKEIFTSEDK